jgi:hypothetical protein
VLTRWMVGTEALNMKKTTNPTTLEGLEVRPTKRGVDAAEGTTENE